MWPFKKKLIGKGKQFGVGAMPDPEDTRDYKYEPALGAAPVDWAKGYDVEKELKIKIPFKNQDGSSSCVGQGWSYYVGVLDAVETGVYDEVSAKAVYSQIFQSGGGAYIRDGAKLIVNFGALAEKMVSSYEGNNAPSENFMRDKSWINAKIIEIAKKLQAKEYRSFPINMEVVAAAIRDNHGTVGGVYGSNNGTWSSGEPQPPVANEWAHCIYFGKYGVDSKGKYIATPNSWGSRGIDSLHPDGWQKLREDYFQDRFMFNPWTLTDKPNTAISPEAMSIINKNEKKFIVEAEGAGRKGIVINGEVRLITSARAAEACLYQIANNGGGTFVTSQLFNEMPKGKDF